MQKKIQKIEYFEEQTSSDEEDFIQQLAEQGIERTYKVMQKNQIDITQTEACAIAQYQNELTDQDIKEYFDYKLKQKNRYHIKWIFFLGVSLLIAGIYYSYQGGHPGHGIPFFIVSVMLLLPGTFFTFWVYKAWISKSKEESKEWLGELAKI